MKYPKSNLFSFVSQFCSQEKHTKIRFSFFCHFTPYINNIHADIMQVAEERNLPGLLMLIGFAKDFDSLSWDFLYNKFYFFGFSENFLKWIRLFNNDIKAYILQCGYISESIKIERGCRQGG